VPDVEPEHLAEEAPVEERVGLGETVPAHAVSLADRARGYLEFVSARSALGRETRDASDECQGGHEKSCSHGCRPGTTLRARSRLCQANHGPMLRTQRFQCVIALERI